MTPTELKTLRARLGLSQRELARELGVATMTVARWEQGVHPISPRTRKTLSLLARATLPSHGAANE